MFSFWGQANAQHLCEKHGPQQYWRHVTYNCQSHSRQSYASFQPADWDIVTLVAVKEWNSSKMQLQHRVSTWSYSQHRALHSQGYTAATGRVTQDEMKSCSNCNMGTIKIGHTELMLHCDGKRKTYKELNTRQKIWWNHVVKTYQADATAHNFHYAKDDY